MSITTVTVRPPGVGGFRRLRRLFSLQSDLKREIISISTEIEDIGQKADVSGLRVLLRREGSGRARWHATPRHATYVRPSPVLGAVAQATPSAFFENKTAFCA